MTTTRTENFTTDDGRTLRLTYAEPERVVRGGLVVLHEGRGLTDLVRKLVDDLAAEGWLVVAPHLYHGVSGVDEVDHHEVPDHLVKLTGQSVLADTDISFAWLAQRGVRADLMGVIGFDLGGAVALVVAARRDIGAAVTVAAGGIVEPLSPGLPALIEVAGDVRCPWLGLYGEPNERIGEAEVEKLRDAAANSGVATTVAKVGEDLEALHRALAWFDAHLR